METQSVVTTRTEGPIAIIEMNNPPVNALSHAVRSGLTDAFAACAGNDDIKAIVLTGSARAFSGGADITEFDKPFQEPGLGEVINTMEASQKPVVAAISGLALGGGLELALGCHFRVATQATQIGLPEVKLGLLPGAGGTQRLPRLIGAINSLKPIVTGSFVNASKAEKLGAIDAVYEDNLVANAVEFANKVLADGTELVPVSRRDEKLAEERNNLSEFDAAAAQLLKRSRGLMAPAACVESVKNALTMSFEEGEKAEVEIFMKLRDTGESKAQRHLFFAERTAQKINDMPKDTKARKINKVAVLGAGTMGGGITMSIASAGIPVTIIDTNEEALNRGLGIIEKNYRKTAARGGLSEEQVNKALELITGSTNFGDISEADLVIEAVFEELALKKKIFADLDAQAKPGAILATNTSYLDVNEIASVTNRPGDVVGMHFFSPANVMRLLEVVRAEKTEMDVLKTAIDIGKRAGKIPVTVGVCHGFVGNRMLNPRFKQMEDLLLEGAAPEQIDRVSTEFGFAMGPCAVGDLAGLDIGWRSRKDSGEKAAPISDALCELGRYGQKTSKGFFLYQEGSRSPIPDPEVKALIQRVAKEEGVEQREISDEEIHERLVYCLINTGAQILEEGIAQRASDIDLIWVNGYGWPIGRGGPMFYADRVGLKNVVTQLDKYADATGEETLRPVTLLRTLADENGTFADYKS